MTPQEALKLLQETQALAEKNRKAIANLRRRVTELERGKAPADDDDDDDDDTPGDSPKAGGLFGDGD